MALNPFEDSLFNKQLSRFFNDDWQIFDPFRDEFFRDPHNAVSRTTRGFAPLLSADLIEKPDAFEVHADLPGVSPEHLEITMHNNNVLEVKAERKNVHEAETDKVHTLERSYGSVMRRIRLPNTADKDRAVSSFRNGVLTVTFPKMDAPAGTRKIPINVVKDT